MASEVAMKDTVVEQLRGHEEAEACRLKSLAEARFESSNIVSALKLAKKAQRVYPGVDGLDSMVTALRILHVAAEADPVCPGSGFIDYYKVLQLEPFSPINSVRKQFKKLALDLHPDKNSFRGCEEAFKVVGEGYRLLSDKAKREAYDSRLRIRLQENVAVINRNADSETFWCACSNCMLSHEFERKYLGHNLVCPSCKMSFKAVEEHLDQEDAECTSETLRTMFFRSERLRKKAEACGGNVWDFGWRKGPILGRSMVRNCSNVPLSRTDMENHLDSDVKRNNLVEVASLGGREKQSGGSRRKNDSVLVKPEPKRVKFDDETMTLAELQVKVLEMVKSGRQKKKVVECLTYVRRNKKSTVKKYEECLAESPVVHVTENGDDFDCTMDTQTQRDTRNISSPKSRSRFTVCGGCKRESVTKLIMYDFDRDRAAKCFKHGQVWAIFDNANDGMPRRYGLIDEVVSMNPFQVKLSWLDLQRNEHRGSGDQETTGNPISCGRFQVTNRMIIKFLDMFSHIVDCERAARAIYRIYPTKGSVWALHGESSMVNTVTENRRDKPKYDIVVFLTTYSDAHGLSMAYLEPVDGYYSLFKRRDVGRKAIQMIGKGDIHLISHQIPARMLADDGCKDLFKIRWELDTASLLPTDCTN